MTLVELVDAHPGIFYRQEWYRAQGFASKPGPIQGVGFPRLRKREPDHCPDCGIQFVELPARKWTALNLAIAFVEKQDDPIWGSFLWTSDQDDGGNPVYVGGVGVYGIEAFQVHRLLDPDHRWVTPL